MDGTTYLNTLPLSRTFELRIGGLRRVEPPLKNIHVRLRLSLVAYRQPIECEMKNYCGRFFEIIDIYAI